jgi:elongation factor Tu
MPVEDVFTISGRGTVATGRVERGEIRLKMIRGSGDRRYVKDEPEEVRRHRSRDVPQDCWTSQRPATTSASCCAASTELRQWSADRLSGQAGLHSSPTPSSPDSVYVLTKDEGGRHTPFFNNYRPQFYFRTTDVTGVITLPEGTEMCMPGDNVEMSIGADSPPSLLSRA